MSDQNNSYFLKDGRGYVVRYFDCEDPGDLKALVQIVQSPEVQRWMENVDNMNLVSIRKWMDEKGESDSFLFAISDTEDAHSSFDQVHGFVYVYPSKILKDSMEVSYAKRPGSPSGLTSPALKVVCELVRDYYSVKRPWRLRDLSFLAEIDRENIPSIKVVERAGFKMVRGYDYKHEALWTLDVSNTKREQIVDITPEKPIIERQITGSHCGPAVVQMLLSQLGIVVDQEEIVDAAGIRKTILQDGTPINKLSLAVKNLYPNLSLWVKRETSIKDLQKLVNEHKYLVAVNWQGVFESDDYPQDEVKTDRLGEWLDKIQGVPKLKGDQGHYCVALEVNTGKGYLRFADPYGHYAGKDRFIAIWEFEDKWWDDRYDKDSLGHKTYVLENRLIFVVTTNDDNLPQELGMVRI